MLEKICSYSPDKASAATSTEDDSQLDDDLPLTAVKQLVLSEDNQQELCQIRNILQQISSNNCQHYESELNKWIDEDEKLLPLHSNDSVSIDERVIDESNVKHEEAISSFNNCIK
ncbi:hypothetical protein QE152_g33839 [Popillia japonica]|uniref:Uncharacterized protein n=1 Tax=Popillia japonica TaxID=7064 RepID=A0AAW1IV50_POPJA